MLWSALFLCRRIQHIFDEDAISGGRIVNKDMGDGAHQFPILNDGTAGHALDDTAGGL